MIPADIPPAAVVHVDDAAHVVRKAPAASRSAASDPTVHGASWVAAPQWHVPASEYVGAYYDPRFEAVRECIVRRESENEPWVVSNDGWGTAGLYQFRQGWSYEIAKRLHRPDLAGVPIQTWSRGDQDAGFWAIWSHGAGASNWAGGRYSCWAAGGI